MPCSLVGHRNDSSTIRQTEYFTFSETIILSAHFFLPGLRRLWFLSLFFFFGSGLLSQFFQISGEGWRMGQGRTKQILAKIHISQGYCWALAEVCDLISAVLVIVQINQTNGSQSVQQFYWSTINSGLHDYTSIQEITETVTSKDTSSLPHYLCVCVGGNRSTLKRRQNSSELRWKTELRSNI